MYLRAKGRDYRLRSCGSFLYSYITLGESLVTLGLESFLSKKLQAQILMLFLLYDDRTGDPPSLEHAFWAIFQAWWWIYNYKMFRTKRTITDHLNRIPHLLLRKLSGEEVKWPLQGYMPCGQATSGSWCPKPFFLSSLLYFQLRHLYAHKTLWWPWYMFAK